MDPFHGDEFAEFSGAMHDDSLNHLVSNSSYCCDFSSSCLDHHHPHHHHDHREQLQQQQHSFSLDAASTTCDLLSDTDSFGIKNHSPGGSSILSSTSCACFFGGGASTDSSSSSIPEQGSFDHAPPATMVDMDQHFPLLESWHLVQYESLPGLLHVPEPMDHFSSSCKLSSSSSPPEEHSSGGLELIAGTSADDMVIIGDIHVQQELFRGARCIEELPGNESMDLSLPLPVAAAVPPMMATAASASHCQSGSSLSSASSSSSGSSNKRQRGCFTLQNVSESLQQHSIIFSNTASSSSSGLSEAMLLQINASSSSSSTNPNPSTSNSGNSGASHGSFSYRLKETVEPQSIAARQRRKKISERVRELEKLVPGGNKLDTASMLDEAIRFVKFLQIQVQLLEAVGNGPVANYGANHCLNVPFNHATTTPRLHFPFSGNCSATTTTAVAAATCSSASNAASTKNSTSGCSSLTAVNSVSSVLLLGRRNASLMPSSSSPLVLTETLQHALFKHKRCVATIQQCPPEHLLL